MLAFLDYARAIVTIVNGLLEDALLPTERDLLVYTSKTDGSVSIPINKISMESVTSWITVGDDKWLIFAVPFKVWSVEDDLVEDGDGAFWERFGAGTSSNTRRIIHMALVVLGVGIFSIPARRKEYLSSKTISTLDVW